MKPTIEQSSIDMFDPSKQKIEVPVKFITDIGLPWQDNEEVDLIDETSNQDGANTFHSFTIRHVPTNTYWRSEGYITNDFNEAWFMLVKNQDKVLNFTRVYKVAIVKEEFRDKEQLKHLKPLLPHIRLDMFSME